MSKPYEESAAHDLLHTIHSQRRVIAGCAEQLYDIANLLYATNNDRLSARVQKIANILAETCDEVSNAHSEMVSESLQETREAMGNLFLALIDRANKEQPL